jgi:hypothetical protein
VKKLFGCTLGLVLLSGCAASGFAQERDRARDRDKSAKSKTKTVTGCLSQGDNPNEYRLTAKDGTTWVVRGNTASVSVGDYVGHMVKATGNVSDRIQSMNPDATADTTTGVHRENPDTNNTSTPDTQTQPATRSENQTNPNARRDNSTDATRNSAQQELQVTSIKPISGSCSR